MFVKSFFRLVAQGLCLFQVSHTLVEVDSQQGESTLSLLLCQQGVLVGVLLGQIRVFILIQQMVSHSKDEGDAGCYSRITQGFGQE